MPNFINQKMLIELTRELQGMRSCVFVSVSGMSATELDNLRAGFGEWNVKFLVVKNQVARRALGAIKIQGVEGFLVGPTAIAYGDSETAIKACKVLAEVMKTSKALTVKGGYLEGKALDGARTRELAKIPSRKELFASILGGVVGLLAAPAALVQSALSQPACLAKALADKKE